MGNSGECIIDLHHTVGERIDQNLVLAASNARNTLPSTTHPSWLTRVSKWVKLRFMDDILADIAHFTGRETWLHRIPRYHIYQPMFYRTTVWVHTLRVCWIVDVLKQRLTERFGQIYDHDRALRLALVHDDIEIIVGDVQAGNKAKMSPEQLKALDTQEREAIDELTKRCPKCVGDFYYRDLLREAHAKKTIESHVVQLADKFDAFGEALHEIYAGNLRFATNVVNAYGTITTPPVFYTQYFRNFARKHPSLAFLFSENPLFQVPDLTTDWHAIAANGRPHTRMSITSPSDCSVYQLWRAILLVRGGEEEILRLTQQRERP